VIRQGQRLFYEVGCFYCHGIQAEGDVGPQIARTELSLDLLIQQVYQPVGDMPLFSPATVSESDLAAIYAYLQTLKPLESRPKTTTGQPDGAVGETLYRYFGCFGCHGYRGEGGFGPRLAGTDLSLEEVRIQLREQQERMPAFGPQRISNEELAHIYAFLQSVAPYDETN
jgi:mono/diheme cytochrome c family protein